MMIKLKHIVLASSLISTTSMSFAAEIGKKPETPQIPNSPYVVHDGTRPIPPAVKTQGAVVSPPPADAVILFDGSSLDAWKQKDKFVIKDGILVAAGGAIQTNESFGDIQVHLEWRVPAKRRVNGQKGGNSGIFLNSAYEVQILQSHNNLTYPDGSAGAMYGQTPPLVNATSKQGEWQSYDIIFRKPKFEGDQLIAPAYLTVIHNGVVIHAHRAYHGPTTHKKVRPHKPSHAKDAPIRLQYHNDPIEYRNIWVRRLGDYDQGQPYQEKKSSK